VTTAICPANEPFKSADAGFLRRDAEDGIFHDVNFRARRFQAFPQLGQMGNRQALIADHDEERRCVQPRGVFLRQ
jgi:hypothetical protein